MRFYVSRTLCFAILLGSLGLTNSSSEFYVESMCSKKVAVRTAIEVHIDYHWFKNECTVFLVPYDENGWLRAFFVQYSSSRPSSGCSHGAVYLYNSQDSSLLGDKGYCLSHTPKGYHALGANGSIRIRKRSESTSLKVRIRIVQYLLKNDTCPPATFDCGPNDLCIPNSLECESHRDCPSGLDEGDQCPDKYSAALWLALVVVIVACCCLCVAFTISSKSKRNIAFAQRGGGRFDGAYSANFGGAPQPGYAMGQVSPYGNTVQGNMDPNYNTTYGFAQPVIIGARTSYTGVQGPQTPYTGVQGPQTNYIGVQGPQTSYTGVQGPQTSYTGVQGPQSPYAGVQSPQNAYTGTQAPQSPYTGAQRAYPPPSSQNPYIPQGYPIQEPMYPPPPYPYGVGLGFRQQGFGN